MPRRTAAKQTPPIRRKGASRMADIPRSILDSLNRGNLETVTLVEWLAIDQAKLLKNALRAVGGARLVPRALDWYSPHRNLGIAVRTRKVGELFHELLFQSPSYRGLLSKLARHPSDMVRAWVAHSIGANPDLAFRDRLKILKRFAADSNMAVRECAWDAFRPYLLQNTLELLTELIPWVHDRNPNLRRCAIEGSRPRGVWTQHSSVLKENPSLGLPLLEPVRSDPSRYVQNAVANWLNDASKSQPCWVRLTTTRWIKESPTEETAYIVRRALRTLRKS